MPATHTLEDTFLAQLKQDETPVSIFLINGIKLHGVVDDYDEYVVMLKSAATQMIFKHAISTVVPGRPV
ncbi:MAG: RNA chaperone Hfq [Legionella sp.]|nr:MAG: RNA chaperone Hfq [Legionella sp.]